MKPAPFNFKNPNYVPVFRQRMERLKEIRRDPSILPALKAYYKTHHADFISDWGCTFDPRNIERNLPSVIPFILFEKQREWIDVVLEHWRNQKPLLSEKSRDCGLSYLAIGLSCSLGLHYDGFSVGFGSRKEEYVDKSTNPKSLFWKARFFMRHLPEEFRGGWLEWRDAPHMRMSFPETGSTITGEAGDQIGRGDRQSIYFIDESAFLERPILIEHSLSQTTNCRVDISSVNGMNNPFAQKRHAGNIDVFVFDWRDDPRKDEAWYEKQKTELDPVTVAQEIDRDYSASVEGIVIPGAWVRAAIDAREKLGLPKSGARGMSLDVADEGVDKNAVCGAHGIEIEHLDEWSGKGDDIFGTVEKAFTTCDLLGYSGFTYDADGLGAGVRGDARVINDRRKAAKVKALTITAFRGSDGVFRPEAEDVKGRTNLDFFANRKAQAWWALRRRFQLTHRWVQAVLEASKTGNQELIAKARCNPDDIISIPAKLPFRAKLVTELSQPTYSINNAGKILVDKAPDGTKSPNLADSVMMKFAEVSKAPLLISDDVLAATSGRGRR